MVDEINFNFNGKSEGNILVMGRTGCEETNLVQNLLKNRMFGDLKEVIWLSKIPLSKDRQDNIKDCFVNEKVSFQYPINIDKFDDLLDYFQRQKV